MEGKIKTVIMLILMGLFGLVAPAFPLSYTTNSLDPGPGEGITYTLDSSLVEGSSYSYHATFTIDPGDNSSTRKWYAGWFLFKFDGAQNPVNIDSLKISGEPATQWSISDSFENTTVKVLTGGGKYKNLLSSQYPGFFGFYVTSLAEGLPDDPTQGINLTGTTSLDFDFTLLDGGVANPDLMPFRVGYYADNPGSGKWEVNQLSAELVPEPATIFLLGSGLVGLGLWGRKKFKVRS